jgi:hypothetical protein
LLGYFAPVRENDSPLTAFDGGLDNSRGDDRPARPDWCNQEQATTCLGRDVGDYRALVKAQLQASRRALVTRRDLLASKTPIEPGCGRHCTWIDLVHRHLTVEAAYSEVEA